MAAAQVAASKTALNPAAEPDTAWQTAKDAPGVGGAPQGGGRAKAGKKKAAPKKKPAASGKKAAPKKTPAAKPKFVNTDEKRVVRGKKRTIYAKEGVEYYKEQKEDGTFGYRKVPAPKK